MFTMIRTLATALTALLITIGSAWAQNTVTLTAAVTSGNGTVTPVLSWLTTPAADDCVASGAWTGSKGAAGSETLVDITSSQTYNLDCTWPGDSQATLSWTLPTLNTDGTPYTDQGALNIYYGIEPARDQTDRIANPFTTSRVLTGLTPGNWCFQMTAENLLGVMSSLTNSACKVITASVTTNESIGITVNPMPQPITGVTVL